MQSKRTPDFGSAYGQRIIADEEATCFAAWEKGE